MQKYVMFKEEESYWEVRNSCHDTSKYTGTTHSIWKLTFNVPNEISVVFYNGSNYNYHFIIKELAKQFEGKFECLGENTKKYKIFSVPIEKEVTDIDKGGNKNVVPISYKIKFIFIARFISTSLSNPLDNLTEEIHKIKCRDCHCFLEYESVKDTLMKYKCLSCNKNYLNKIDEEL